MPNIGVVLKTEIARLSKKVVKAHVQPLQLSSASQRKQIAAMRRQISALEREMVHLRKGLNRPSPAPAKIEDEGGPALRFQARGLRTLRARLGLSAEDFGKLVGVSGQSVYNWEAEKTIPRRSQLASLSKVRGMGKREVTKMLAATS